MVSNRFNGIHVVLSKTPRPTKSEVIALLAQSVSVCREDRVLDDQSVYAEIVLLRYTERFAVLKMIGHNSLALQLGHDENEVFATFFENLNREARVLARKLDFFPELYSVVFNEDGDTVGFVDEYIEGYQFEDLLSREISVELVRGLLTDLVDDALEAGYYVWDLDWPNLRFPIDAQGDLSVKLVDAGAVFSVEDSKIEATQKLHARAVERLLEDISTPID